jgi:hypothetical protein
MLPQDTQTIVVNASGTQNIVLIPKNTTNTILGVAISQENLASDTNLVCRDPSTGDQMVIMTNFAKTISYAEMNFVCPNGYNVELQKTGDDQSQTILNYVAYDRTAQVTDSQNTAYAVSILIVIAGFLFFNLIWRIFANARR